MTSLLLYAIIVVELEVRGVVELGKQLLNIIDPKQNPLLLLLSVIDH